jgi:hypothetical protein
VEKNSQTICITKGTASQLKANYVATTTMEQKRGAAVESVQFACSAPRQISSSHSSKLILM